MDEKSFWPNLEFRLCREFAGIPQRPFQCWWCDGFVPSEAILDGPSPRIIGRCWIVDGQNQESWEFALFLPRTYGSRDEIDWASLLPAENVTRWMSFDERRKYIEFEPAVAVPDLA